MNIISDIFTAVGQAVQGFSTALSSAVTSVTSMFYTTGENGGLTVLGTLLVIAIGCGLVYFGFRLIKGLIRHA